MIEIVRADITTLAVDAIVNAANQSLRGGGGVDGAMHRAAGPELLLACERHGPCRTSEAVLTPGFRLPARYVIHAVGPVWSGGSVGERALLERTYSRVFEVARRQKDIVSIALPAISTGAYAFPKASAAEIALRVMHLHEPHFERIIAALFDEESACLYRETLSRLRAEPKTPEFPGELWRTYADTILEFPDAPKARVDLRQPVTVETRALLASRGLPSTFAVVTAEFPIGGSAVHAGMPNAATDSSSQALLEARLARTGVSFRLMDGVSPDGTHRERSVAVALARTEAVALARELHQHAIFWFDGASFWLCPTHSSTAPRRLPLESA